MLSEEKLIAAAIEARGRAYAPYSKFKVGAALLTQDGEVYQGCNIECAAYSATNCAERTALYTAVAQGEHHFAALAVVGGTQEQTDCFMHYCPPCGVCRQMLSEFCAEDFKIILAKSIQDYKVYTLGELLPLRFSL